MGTSCYLNSPAPLTGDELRALMEVLVPLAENLEWGCEAFTLEGAVQPDGLYVATKIHNEDSELLWRDLMQCLALSVVASRTLKERLFRFEDDLDLVGAEIGRVGLRGGAAEDEEVDLQLRRQICEVLDGTPFGIEAPEQVEGPIEVEADSDPAEEEGGLLKPFADLASDLAAAIKGAANEVIVGDETLSWPPPGVVPQAWSNRPNVRSLRFEQEAPDGAGDRALKGEYVIQNGDDIDCWRLGIKALLLDDDGRVVEMLNAQKGPVAAGESVTFNTSGWLFKSSQQKRHKPVGSVSRIELWVTRVEREEQAVQVKVEWQPPDDDGDRRANFHFRCHLTRPADTARLHIGWEGGVEEEEYVGALGVGDQLVEDTLWQMSDDDEDRYGESCTATLELLTTTTWKGPDAPQDMATALRHATLATKVPAPVESTEGESTPDLPDDAGPWERVLAGDIDGALQRLDELDSEGRERTRILMQSESGDEVVAGLRIARHCNWRSSITPARRLFHHDDPRVREQACLLCGSLGGPSLVIPLRGMLKDPDPRVRRAADSAIAEIEA